MKKHGADSDEIARRTFYYVAPDAYASVSLAETVALVFGVRYLSGAELAERVDTRYMVTFCGSAARVEIAAYAFGALSRQLGKELRVYMGGVRMKPGNREARGTSWARGWIFETWRQVRAWPVSASEQTLIDAYLERLTQRAAASYAAVGGPHA
ncbi:DUF7168 domain-containing protein [Salmonella enterica]